MTQYYYSDRLVKAEDIESNFVKGCIVAFVGVDESYSTTSTAPAWMGDAVLIDCDKLGIAGKRVKMVYSCYLYNNTSGETTYSDAWLGNNSVQVSVTSTSGTNVSGESDVFTCPTGINTLGHRLWVSGGTGYLRRSTVAIVLV